MKTLLTITTILFFSINGISQPSSVTHELSVIDQPYEWACGEGYLDWENYPNSEGYDCPTASNYYVDFLTVLPGNRLTSFEIDVSELNCFEKKFLDDNGIVTTVDTLIVDTAFWTRSTFHSFVWTLQGSQEIINDLNWMSGIDIIDADDESVLYINRSDLLELYSDGNIIVDSLNIEQGEYEIRIIHNEVYNSGTSNSSEITISKNINGEIFNVANMTNLYTSYLSGTAALGGKEIGAPYNGPEIVATSITYNFEFTDFEWGVATFNQCDSVGFTIEAPHNPELIYEWLYNGLTATGANGSMLTPPPGVSSASGVHNYTVSASSPTGDILMQNSFVLNMHQNPYWGYSVSSNIIYGAQEACPLMFEVDINADDAQLLNSVYTWEPDTTFLELNFMDFGINGASANFCFDPYSSGDTIAVFYVEGTNNYGISGFEGCTTLDSAYVLYNDADSTIDIKSLPPPSAPTSIFEMKDQHQALLYPNPTNSRITIDHDFVGAVRFEILDLSGRIVRQTQTTGRLEMDVSDLPQGLYITVVGDGENRAVNRLVKF